MTGTLSSVKHSSILTFHLHWSSTATTASNCKRPVAPISVEHDLHLFTGVAPFLLVVYVPPRLCHRAELLQEAGAREQNILRFLSGRSEHWWQVTLQHLHLLFSAILALTKYHVEFVPFSSSPSFLAGLTLCTVSKGCKTCVRKCSLLIFNFFVLAYQLA